MTHWPIHSNIPDWVWFAVGALFVVVAYTWARRGTAAAPKAKAKPPEKPAARDRKPTDKASPKAAQKQPAENLPRFTFEEADDVDPTKVGNKVLGTSAVAKPIIYDEDAAIDERTHSGALILVSGTAQTDKGLRRKRNEDAILTMPEQGIYVVADGMGGYRGGEIASALAVKAIERAFQTQAFAGKLHEGIPQRASELVRSIEMANAAIFEHAERQRELRGMGTTICAARFSPNKQRLYVGHVGDSRMYRLRNGTLTQLTSDHTMGDFGVTGDAAAHLSRAVGIWPQVDVDVILCKPRPRDIYLVCSDGLTKMVSDELLSKILVPTMPPDVVAEALIDTANRCGGRDNISAIVIRIDDPVVAA